MDRILARTVPDPCGRGCWIWTGTHARHPTWRPIMRWRGRNVIVARLVLWWVYGRALRRGYVAGHTCPGGGNKNCVNPAHLREQRYSTNNSRRWRRPRPFTDGA